MASSVAQSTVKASLVALTDQQRAAIETRDVSVALSAGAGCGKTFVLTERFLSHLDPTFVDRPADLSELIAITFTERAAREMRDRIRQKCFQRLQAAEQEHVDYWLSLLRSLDGARVSTIHSFCAALLRSHAVDAGLDPGFSVLDQTQADTLLAETLEDFLREKLIAKDETTLRLVVRFGLERLREMIASLLAKSADIDFPHWSNLTAEALVASWKTYHRETFFPAVLRKVTSSVAARDIDRILSETVPTNRVMAERREILLQILPNLASSSTALHDLEVIRDNAKVQGGGTKTAWPDEQTYEAFKGAAAQLRKEIDCLLEVAELSPEQSLADAQAGLELLALTYEVVTVYDRKKSELMALDFGDLMARTRKMLSAPGKERLRESLSAGVQLLLVDEFQDTDPGQVELVKALCGGDVRSGKLFFVGDRKQSIYRFRGAQPRVFHRLRHEVPERGRLPLKMNFRSQPAILDFVNALFADEFSDANDSQDSVLLTAHRPQVTPTPAVEFLWTPTEGSRTERGASERARRQEARWIASRIRSLLDSKEPVVADKNHQPRPAQPGDIAILFRALSDVALYEQALQEYEIDYYLVGGHAFYAQQEIFDVLNFLRSISSQCDDVSLAGVLRSPFFSLSDETLFWLVEHGKNLPAGLFSSQLPPQIDEEQANRVRFAAETIKDLRSRKDRLGIAQLLNEILAITGYDAILLADFLGQRKLANVRKLIQQARNLERGGMFSLADFIVQLSQFVVKQPHEPLAATHPENTDVIRLMTIHQSKGLEFPIVIVPDIDRASHRSTAAVEFTPELGPLVRVPPPGGATVTGCSGLDLHSMIAMEEEQEEMVRLFYVATTRAADRLILSSSVFNIDAPAGPWMKLLGRRFSLQTGALTAELPPGVNAPSVLVTTEKPQTAFRPASRSKRVDLSKVIANAQSAVAERMTKPVPFVDPIPVDPLARRKYSFSRLTGELQLREQPEDHAALGDELTVRSSVDPLSFGTLIHAILADPTLAAANVTALVHRYAEMHLPDAEPASLEEAVELIDRYVQSPCAAAVYQAKDAFREVEFLLAWPPDDGPRSHIYLHGFIDCLYCDGAGAWHLLDYKTNHVSKSSVRRAAAPYEMQMFVYALAAEQVLRVPPSSLTLHFLKPGVEHQFPWNDESREKTIELVNTALQSIVSKSTTPQQPATSRKANKPVKRSAETQQRLW